MVRPWDSLGKDGGFSAMCCHLHGVLVSGSDVITDTWAGGQSGHELGDWPEATGQKQRLQPRSLQGLEKEGGS